MAFALLVLVLVSVAEGFLFSQELCFPQDGLGCFGTDFPYNNSEHTVPNGPSEINLSFSLRTRGHAAHFVTKTASSIAGSHYDATKPTVFIIHGYMSSGLGDRWPSHAASLILQKQDANVFVVDWAGGAKKIVYYKAVANTRVVAALIVQFIQALEAHARTKPADITLIGHSLGAHISGYVGEDIHGIGRITGLDPAGPAFRNNDPRARLDPTDALYVEAIHTDGESIVHLGFGMIQPVGDVDIYPNGGLNQPGCPRSAVGNIINLVTLSGEDLAHSAGCSHLRAVDYFLASFTSTCHFRAYPCSSPEVGLAGRCSSCGSGCAVFGYNSPKVHHGQYYLTTTSTSPFCVH